MKTVVVAGASGYLGRYVVTELAGRGYRVRALVRTGRAVENADETFVAEATRPESLVGLCDGAAMVFSSLGITRQRESVTFEQVDHLANANILAEAKRAAVNRFGFLSVVHPETFASCAIVEARERFVDELMSSGLEARLVRATGFFNDLSEPFRMAQKGRVFLIGDGTARINPIHGADLATACVAALESSDPLHLVGGPDILTWNEIADLAFEVLGKRPTVTHVPEWFVGSALPVIRITSRRAYDLASFVRRVLVNDVTAPTAGCQHLSDFYRALAREAGLAPAER